MFYIIRIYGFLLSSNEFFVINIVSCVPTTIRKLKRSSNTQYKCLARGGANMDTDFIIFIVENRRYLSARHVELKPWAMYLFQSKRPICCWAILHEICSVPHDPLQHVISGICLAQQDNSQDKRGYSTS